MAATKLISHEMAPVAKMAPRPTMRELPGIINPTNTRASKTHVRKITTYVSNACPAIKPKKLSDKLSIYRHCVDPWGQARGRQFVTIPAKTYHCVKYIIVSTRNFLGVIVTK